MKTSHKVLMIAAIILAALSMRSPITGVGPVVGVIQQELSLSNSAAGMITTIPVIVFAVFSPFVSKIAGKIGTGRAMAFSMIILSLAIILRSFAGAVGFFVATAFVGLGIVFSNVLIPSIIKHSFPNNVGKMTSVYTTCISGGSAMASAASVPLSKAAGFGWRGALAVWSAISIAAAIAWLMQMGYKAKTSSAEVAEAEKTGSILKSPISWSVACYMGMQSLLFYSLAAWLPSILAAKPGIGENAGYFAAIFQFIGILGSFSVPILAGKFNDQRGISAVVAASYAFCIVTLMFSNSIPLIVIALMLGGLATGSTLSLAMCLISMRTNNAQQTAALSGFAQTFGYSVAAISPTLLGALYDRFATWTAPLLFLLVIVGFLAIAGNYGGKKRTI